MGEEELAEGTRRYLGADIGGTNIRAGVVDEGGRILGEARRPALAESGLRAAVGRAIEALQEALDNAGISSRDVLGIGVGVPGAHRSKEGITVYSPNFADSRGVPVLPPIKEAFDLPSFMLNDVAVTTLGEHRFGAGQGYSNMVMITLGTGIGGGAIIDGELRVGHTEGFAEVGHMTVDPEGPVCGCGNRGCWEALAARDAIVARAVAKIQRGRATAIADSVDYRLGSITPALIGRCADQGDEVAIEVLAETGYYLGIGIANLIQLFNPQVLVIGGGIAQSGRWLFEPITRTVRARAHMVPASTCRLVPAQLGDDAGIIGGAVLAALELKKQRRSEQAAEQREQPVEVPGRAEPAASVETPAEETAQEPPADAGPDEYASGTGTP
ncbi:MAG: ROK family protein [Armatimonadetes bacterium]|nr:ROK family protein [Armatimonadota bacterium]